LPSILPRTRILPPGLRLMGNTVFVDV